MNCLREANSDLTAKFFEVHITDKLFTILVSLITICRDELIAEGELLQQ